RSPGQILSFSSITDWVLIGGNPQFWSSQEAKGKRQENSLLYLVRPFFLPVPLGAGEKCPTFPGLFSIYVVGPVLLSKADGREGSSIPGDYGEKTLSGRQLYFEGNCKNSSSGICRSFFELLAFTAWSSKVGWHFASTVHRIKEKRI